MELMAAAVGLRRGIYYISAARWWNVCTEVESFREPVTVYNLLLVTMDQSYQASVNMIHVSVTLAGWTVTVVLLTTAASWCGNSLNLALVASTAQFVQQTQFA